ncbi:hypothetical protein [Pseudoroseicyclus sp. CXY001]|uniref:hypothetical protein n=1 Tax=Pseudoroseicyclus sp. CXY001 TaxID=3242492 RepID=UPI003570D27D
MDYRGTARKHCEAAKTLLSSGTDDDLLLATLKLRMALECITYDRSKGFTEDLGPDAMKTWQPKKLMERMLEVDPQADADATLAFGEEPFPGETPASMRLLGTDHVLNLRTLKKHYDALGAHLHAPTLSQLEQRQHHDFGKLRARCERIVEALETALSSKVWNSTLAIRGEIECVECGAVIRRRLPRDKAERVVECWSCPASYTMSETEDQKVTFKPRQIPATCPQADCGEAYYIWERDAEAGASWKCQGCQSQLTLALGVVITPAGQ